MEATYYVLTVYMSLTKEEHELQFCNLHALQGRIQLAVFGGGGGSLALSPNLGYPKTENSTDLTHYFFGCTQIHFKKNWELYDSPLPGLWGAMAGLPPPPLDPPVQPVGTNQTNQATSSVPKFVDLCGRRHPVVNNFPLSHVIFKVNFPHSNDPWALVSAKRQQQHFNGSLSQVDLELSWAMNSSVFNNLANRVS